jgi:hypothetical protein
VRRHGEGDRGGARASVRDGPDLVDRLPARPADDDDAASPPGAVGQPMEDRRGHLLGARELRLPFRDRGDDHLHPPGAQALQVLPDGGVLPHRLVHRRCDEDRDPAPQRDRGEGGERRVVDPVGDLGEGVRRRRGDEEQVGAPLPGPDLGHVLHRTGELGHRRVPGGEMDRLLGDDPRRLGAHDGEELRAVAQELARDPGDLDGGDRTGDAEDDPSAREQLGAATPDGTARMHGNGAAERPPPEEPGRAITAPPPSPTR